jgi:hypothetical protein
MTEAGEATRRDTVWDRLLAGSPQDRLLSLLSWAIVGVGALVQIYYFLGARSLRQDEAFIALNVRFLSVHELLGPLDYVQVAPVGWLLSEKLLDGLTGRYEYDLRLLSLLAGLIALIAFRHLAARTTRGAGFLCAVTLFACSEVFVWFTADAKPYALDIMFACLIPAIGLHLMTTARPKWWAWVAFLLVGVVACPFSIPAVYILFGVGSAVALKKAVEKDWRAAAATAAICAVWLVAFAAVFLLLSEPQAQASGGSVGFFETYFAPLPRSLSTLTWYVTTPKAILYYFFGGQQFAVTALILVGVIYGFRRDPWLLLMLLLPALAAVIGSGLKLYPLFERLTLFMLPATILLAGVGFSAIMARGRSLAGAAVLFIAAVGPSAWALAGDLAKSPPFAMQEIRPVLRTLAQKVRPGDVVYVTSTTAPAYIAYQADMGLGRVPWVRGDALGRWNCVIADAPTVGPEGRLWVLIAEYDEKPWSMLGNDREWRARGLLADTTLEAESTRVWLYRVTMKPAPAGEPPLKPDPDQRKCSRQEDISQRTTARAQAALSSRFKD